MTWIACAARRALLALAIAGAAQSGCSVAQPSLPATAPPPSPPPRPASPPPAGSYWEPLDATVDASVLAPPLPLAEAQIALVAGAGSRWSALSPPARAALLERGFVEVPPPAPGARFGRAYRAFAAGDVPYVVTVDALFWVAHVARDRALAAAEDASLAPALDAFLRRLEDRLTPDARGAPADLAPAFALARGLVAVARALLSPSYRPPADLARVVAQETGAVAAHAGPGVSPLLGLTVDYSQIVPRGAADASAARSAYARAVAWLSAAPFGLAARSEVEGAQLSVSAVRAHARAALLIARLADAEVDAEAAAAWRHWAAVAEFVGGKSDDVSLRELLDAAGSAGMDVRTPRALIDVARLDRLRHALLAGHAARLDDGAAIAGVSIRRSLPAEAAPAPPLEFLRAATTVRVLPSRSAPDALAMQALVFPSVGALAARGARAADAPPGSARDGVRALPRALDVAAWLGAADAPALLHETDDDAYERYAETLQGLYARRPPEAARHDSVYASSLDAIATYLAPSAADGGQPGAGTSAWRRRKLESGLAAWTTLRHDALSFARFPLGSASSAPAPDLRPAADGLPAFVEPHPEAIGRLVSLVRQTSRGLRALGEISDASPALPLLDAADRLLADAFVLARREANDEPFTAADRDALAGLPARLAALEEALVASHAAEASLAVDVHTDLATGRALVEATGDLGDLYVVMREPHTGRLLLVVGACASHYEVTSPSRARPSDAVWRARLHGTPPPERAPFTRAYLAPPAERDPPDGGEPDASGTD